MPTYCTPGRPGRFVVPGLLIGAAFIASSVCWANAFAAFWYSGIASAQVHSQPDAFVFSTGASAYPFLPLTGLSSASSDPAATVASYHMATLPCWYWVEHSL